jgi:hypothetical protein
MKDHTRRAVALIAGCIITGKNPSSVYDYSQSKYFQFSGETTPTTVNVYDYDERCYVGGSGDPSSQLNLYHYGNSKYITLKIEGDKFNGYDYDTQRHFNGSVNGNSISLYDDEKSQHYNFSI